MTYPVKANISQSFGENPTANIRPGSPDYWIIQQFGNYQPDGHTGIDIACPVGTEVQAVADGVVLHVGWMGGTYADNPWWIAPGFAGYCAVIDHGSFIGIYGHCKDGSAKVGKGAGVRAGQVFILSGNTGGSTGPHLHFEVLPDGYNLNARFYGRVNPLPYLNSAPINPAGNTTETLEPQEDTLAKAEVDEIKAHIDARIDNIALPGEAKVRNAGPLYGLTTKVDRIDSALLPGVAGQRQAGPVYAALATIQGQNDGLREAVKQLAEKPGQPIDLAQVEAAATAGAEKALANLRIVSEGA